MSTIPIEYVCTFQDYTLIITNESIDENENKVFLTFNQLIFTIPGLFEKTSRVVWIKVC